MRFQIILVLIMMSGYLWSQDSTKSKSLREVNVKAQKPQVKVEAGKTTLETSSATIQQGTLKDLLQQMPGVVLDNNNNVSVKGKMGLRVLVDGKTSQLALSDMKSFIESIPASSIKSIEILTNPGAEYDAEGKAGIIHIRLKKDKREGYNTRLSAGVGSMANKYNFGVFSNYKNEVFNLFGNYQFNYNDQWFGYSENRFSDVNNRKQYYDYVASWRDFDRRHNVKAGLDLFITKNITLGYTFDYNLNNGHGRNNNENPSEVYDENKILTTKFLAYNNGTNVVHTISHGLSMRQTYDSSKSEWTADVTYTNFDQQNNNLNENFAYDANSNSINSQYYYFEPNLRNKVHNIMFKTDVSIPSSFAKFNIGLKNESTFNQNIYRAYLKNFGGERYTSDFYSNDFNYNDNVFASYMTVSKTLGILTMDAGLRAENTVISSNNPEVARQYLNFFPNIGMTMPIDSFTSISGRYSRRIDRPSFNQLNNRIVFYNRYTANIGVPTLQPEIANIISAQIERSFMNGALNISLGGEYNIERNNISEFNLIDTTGVSYFTSGNIGESNLFSGTLNVYYRPSEYLDINITPQYLYSSFYTNLNGVVSTSEGGAFQLFGQVNIKLPLDFKLSLNGFLNSTMIWPQGNSDFLGVLNGSLSKSFLKNKLNVVLSCQDILNSNTWIGRQTTGNISSRGVWKPETRIAWLNFTYNLGKKINYRRKEIEKSDRIKSTGR